MLTGLMGMSEAKTGPGTQAEHAVRLRYSPDGALGRRFYPGLSGKLLALTLLFVTVAEILIFVPAIANFRLNWLNDRLAAAHTAALVLDAAPSGMVPEPLARQILDSVGAKAVAMKMGDQRRLLAIADVPPAIRHDVDMRAVSKTMAVVDALATMFVGGPGDYIRVVGDAPMGGQFLEIVLPETPLRNAMIRFSRNVLLISLVISLITAGLIYFALNMMFVRPMRRITANMVAFHKDPEDPARVIVPSNRRDEIATAETELAAMQRDLASMLHQKSRLAALGLAVSKINHDLRNLLASAQLFSDQLSTSADPKVQRFAPKLMRAIERAIDFCQTTLSYGAANEPEPDRRLIPFAPVVPEARDALGLGDDEPIRWIVSVERGLMIDADPEQLFRVLLNLARNARQAIDSATATDPGFGQIRVTGRRVGAVVEIEVSDTGPGFSEKARAHLFEAFQGSTRAGGSGLGLAIVAELVRAHGGDVRLVDGTIGATFHITIPDRAVDLGARRSA
jgi:signal transduction histidine kinase